MRVGCPKEIKNREYRVGLTPESAKELVKHGRRSHSRRRCSAVR